MMDVSEFNDLVTKTYSRIYNLQQQDGCKGRGVELFKVPDYEFVNDYTNDTIPEDLRTDEMGVSFKGWLERDPSKPLKSGDDFSLDLWWERNFYPDTQTILNDLYKKDILKAGEYVIIIDW